MNNIDLNFEIYSFDIFDTLITRTFLRPIDIFYELACRLIKDGIIDCHPKKFQEDRIIAEQKAREASNLEDINFNDIYEYMYNYSNIELLKLYEIEMELLSTSPIVENINLVKKLIDIGKKVIIVSDMYHSKDTIMKLLKKNNIFICKNNIYISSEYGLTKRTGNLFHKICEINNFSYDGILHIGNDWKADCVGANKAGLKYVYYKNWKNNNFEKSSNLDISSLGVSRAERLKSNSGLLNQLSVNCISPLLYDYVSFIIKKSVENNFKELIFLSRDGQIFYKIAKKIISEKKIDINLKYIQASRKLLAYPSINSFDINNLNWLIKDSENNFVSDIVDRLELGEFNDILMDFFGGNIEVGVKDLIYFIDNFKNTEIEKYIIAKALFYRKNLINYMKLSGVKFDNIVIVDIGWRLNMQFFLKKCVENFFSKKIKITGFYLGVNYGHISLKNVGEVFAFIKHSNADVNASYTNNLFFKKPSIMVLEHVFCCADHLPLKEYPDGNFIPKLEKVNPDLYNDIMNIHNKILEYTITRAKFLSIQESEMVSIKNALIFIFNPSYNQVLSLKNFVLNKDFTHNEKYSKNIIYPIVKYRDFNKSDWVYGSISISSFWVRAFVFPIILLNLMKIYRL